MNAEAKWQQYRADFLSANACTADAFALDYIAFQLRQPDTRAYRLFARKYKIVIHHEPGLPEDLRVKLCVDIAAIKVMSATYADSVKAVGEILFSIDARGRRG
jgi:hypothetical protein